MLNEQWKAAPGYPRYEVSSLGRVRSRDKNWTHNLRWGTAKENAEDRERHRQQRLNS